MCTLSCPGRDTAVILLCLGQISCLQLEILTSPSNPSYGRLAFNTTVMGTVSFLEMCMPGLVLD